MEQLAWLLADADPALAAGDVVCLRGGVGAGKSYFSRAFIRAAVGDEQMPVPSPTFLLQQSYEVLAEKPLTIHHFDLYRLENVPEAALQRLDLPGCFSAALCLVEWPERLPAHQLPSTRLDMHIEALAAQPCEQAPGGYSGAEEEEEEEEDEDEFSDRRPRACTLAAHGERWQRRLSRLHQVLLSASMDELMGVQVQGSC
jgi:tRNA threonylcarbamoyl adenosine modification protein YjeE